MLAAAAYQDVSVATAEAAAAARLGWHPSAAVLAAAKAAHKHHEPDARWLLCRLLQATRRDKSCRHPLLAPGQLHLH